MRTYDTGCLRVSDCEKLDYSDYIKFVTNISARYHRYISLEIRTLAQGKHKGEIPFW
jgi:hypothetical protein